MTTTMITEYSQTEAALAELSARYKGVIYDVASPEAMVQAKKARAELRGYRVSLEKIRVDIKAPALKRCQLIDTEAKRITSILESLENPIDQQIKAEEQRKENERLAKERAEADRVAAEQAAIKAAEEKRMAEERAEIARRQAELDRAERERREAEAATRAKIESEERAARMRIEEEERKARLAREEADRTARMLREAEERKLREAREAEEIRLKAERDRIESERRAIEEQKRKEREAEEAEQREILRQENELLDGVEMLKVFLQRFGKRVEFAVVVNAILAYLKKLK